MEKYQKKKYREHVKKNIEPEELWYLKEQKRKLEKRVQSQKKIVEIQKNVLKSNKIFIITILIPIIIIT